ncbi:hypothetical protein [Nocardia sp. NPDC020380]|uniref:hypothetical protein n=1 Tax=Nocardia sp. NPDC020380 TaxID=3364309 RepID=UPI00378E2669
MTELHAWLVDSTGRVLAQDVSADSTSFYHLPGSSTGLQDLPEHPSVLLQELLEESQVVLADAVHLGYKATECYPDWSTRWFSAEPVAHARMVGLISEIRPLPPDPDAERLGKRLYRRYLTPLQSAPETLTHWKYANSSHIPPASPDHAAAMAVAAHRWGVPVSAPLPLSTSSSWAGCQNLSVGFDRVMRLDDRR